VEQEPPWQDSGEGHRYRCHIAPAELAEAQRAGEVPERDEAGTAS